MHHNFRQATTTHLHRGRRMCLPLLLAVTALALAATPAVASACPNHLRRAEQAATNLPDCRAYELVTPAKKDNGEPRAVPAGFNERNALEGIPGARAAIDGERFAWLSEYEMPQTSTVGTPSLGLQYVSTRGDAGWTTEPVIPPQSPQNGVNCDALVGIAGWSENLASGVLADGYGQQSNRGFFNNGLECGHDEPRLAPGETEGFQNLFVRNSSTRAYQLVNVTPTTSVTPAPASPLQRYQQASFLAGSAHLNHVAFEEELPLTEAAPGWPSEWENLDNLYVWSEEQSPAVRLVTFLPDGTPALGKLAGSTPLNAAADNVAPSRHAMSANGDRIFFEAEGNLYVRENPDRAQSAEGSKGECIEPEMACTVRLDLPQGGAGPGGHGKWLAANAEGTKVLFTDEATAGLTADTHAGSGTNLYEYSLPTIAGQTGTLTDLTPSGSAEVLGISGVGEAGGYVYFVADGALADAAANSTSTAPKQGAPNLYVSHEGHLAFIATLATEDACDWASDSGCRTTKGVSTLSSTARVSTNGRFLAFNSIEPLTKYDNVDPVTAKPNEEIYLYDAATMALSCASCNPSGPPTNGGAAIDAPTPAYFFTDLKNVYPSRNVSDSGEVYFESAEALAPEATNGTTDVYEYASGRDHLISSGTAQAPAYFLDATPSGSDVFFATAQPLLRVDGDSTYDIYDARVGGGFAQPATGTQPCQSESACENAPSAKLVPSTPSSATFRGAGDIGRRGARTKDKNSGKRRRKARLVRALRRCERRHRHNAKARRKCRRRVRTALARKQRKQRRGKRRGAAGRRGTHGSRKTSRR